MESQKGRQDGRHPRRQQWRHEKTPWGPRSYSQVKEKLLHAKGRSTNPINEDGWQTVLPRNRQTRTSSRYRQTGASSRQQPAQGLGKREFRSKETEQAYLTTFKEGRCFRCLAKDHKAAQCRDPVRCFKCKGTGHKFGWCKVDKQGMHKSQPTKTTPRTDNLSFVQILKRNIAPPHPTPIPQNKPVPQTKPSPLQDEPPVQPEPQPKPRPKITSYMDQLVHMRPEETHAYVPSGEAIQPENGYLMTTGMVVMVQGQPTQDLPRAFARRLAARYGGAPYDYEVYNGNPEEDAPFMLIVRGEALLQQIVWNSPYTLRHGVQVGVIPWDRIWNTVFNPPPYQVWIRLVGLPQHAWNMRGIKKATASLGRVTAVLPYGRQARHFRHITLRLARGDPRELHRFVLYQEGPRTTRVRVELLHWREWQEGPYPYQQDQGPQQHPWQVHHPPPPPEGSAITSNGTGTSEDSSGASHSINGPHGRGFKVWRVKPKLHDGWVKRRRSSKKGTPKVTMVGAQKIPPKTSKPHKMLHAQVSLLVSFKRSEWTFQIWDKKAKVNLVKVGLTFSPQGLHLTVPNIKCYVLFNEQFGPEVQHALFSDILCLGNTALTWIKERVQQKGLQSKNVEAEGQNNTSVGQGTEAQSNDMNVTKERGNQVTGGDWAEQEIFKDLIWADQGQDWPISVAQNDKAGFEEEDMGFQEEGDEMGFQDEGEDMGIQQPGDDMGSQGEEDLGFPEERGEGDDFMQDIQNMGFSIAQPQQTDQHNHEIDQKGLLSPTEQPLSRGVQVVEQGGQEDELQHPPGFPVKLYGKEAQVPADKPIRRSPRLLGKKKQSYAKPKKATAAKFKIHFQQQAAPIKAVEAIELVKESGTKVTNEIEEMFYEAEGGRETGKGALSVAQLGMEGSAIPNE